MAKRKAPSQAAHSTKRAKTRNISAQPFRLFDLPAELYADILALAASDGGKALLGRRSRSGDLSSVDAVSLGNKQLRRDYLAALYANAQTTVAQVLDFDFRHVVTFFNRLNAAEMKALPDKSLGTATVSSQRDPAARTVEILMCFTSPNVSEGELRRWPLERYAATSVSCDLLLRWLKRQSHPHKKGVRIELRYSYADDTASDWAYWMLIGYNGRPLLTFPESTHEEILKMNPMRRPRVHKPPQLTHSYRPKPSGQMWKLPEGFEQDSQW